jgi:hypothetical protein
MIDDDDLALAPLRVTQRRVPSLLNGRFQSDLVNLLGVAATAAGADLAENPPDSLVLLGQVMSVALSVVAGLAFFVTLGLLASGKWRRVFGKGALVFYLLATLVEAAIGATICVGLFQPKEDLKALVLGGTIAVVILLVVQLFRQGYTSWSAQRREAENYQRRRRADGYLGREAVERITREHRESRAELRAQVPIALGILLILLGAVFSVVQIANGDLLAGPPDGPVYCAALGWVLIEVVTAWIVFRRFDRPRRGYDDRDHRGPWLAETVLGYVRSAVIVTAMALLLLYAAYPSDVRLSEIGWTLVTALGMALAGVILGMGLALLNIYVKASSRFVIDRPQAVEMIETNVEGFRSARSWAHSSVRGRRADRARNKESAHPRRRSQSEPPPLRS